MALSNKLNPVFETTNAKKKIISATTEGSTRSLHQAESGSLIVLDRAAGIVITLPAPNKQVGIYYDFIAKTSVSSNAYKIITNSSSVYVLGSVLSIDTDTSNTIAAFVSGSTGTAVAISMNGTTTGGLVGSRYRATSIDATHWLIEGVNYGSASVSTPFANS